MDPVVGARFGTMDPLCEKYYEVSPYAYCGGDPINKIDPDGKLIIFVNGKIGGGSPPAGEPYWGGKQSSFVKGAINYYHDSKTFFTSEDYGYLSSAVGRIAAGYEYAKNNIDAFAGLIKDGETIKFVTHSMGSAFAEGMAKYLIESGYTVEELVHLNAYQAADITTNQTSYVKTVDYQNVDDWVINDIPFFSSPGQIQGADYVIRELSQDPDLYTRHRTPMNVGGEFWKGLDRKKVQSSQFVDSPIKEKVKDEKNVF
jgi:hypothetical protein